MSTFDLSEFTLFRDPSDPREADRSALLWRANEVLQEQIYERHRVVELLEESEQRWRSLVQDAPDTILLVNRDYTIGYINRTELRPELGSAGVTGKSAFDFIFPEYVPQVIHDLERVFERGETVTNEIEAPDVHGNRHWIQSRISPIRRNGVVTAAVVVCRNITEHKRAAEQLRQTQEQLIYLARVTSVGEMAAGLAHELNQPLAAIANYVRGCMIRLQAAGFIDPAILASLQEAVNEAHRASEVIRRLRHFLQHHEPQRQEVSLNVVAQEAARLAEPACRRLGATIRLRLAPALPPLYAERVQLIQVLLNLLLNGAEAMAELPAACRELIVETWRESPTTVAVAVRDRGPGVPPDLGESIFEAFVTTKPHGLGMGLSISRTIVEAHHGKLRYVNLSEPRGARFLASFPLSPPASTHECDFPS